LKQSIKEWVKLEDESKTLKQQLRKINHAKKEMSIKNVIS
jgi:hypothetical protein